MSFFRLWDAVGGFLFLFSHMQDKLSKHSSQVDLLKELLNLQKDMITMMLSMLEGNVVNGKPHYRTLYCRKFIRHILARSCLPNQVSLEQTPLYRRTHY